MAVFEAFIVDSIAAVTAVCSSAAAVSVCVAASSCEGDVVEEGSGSSVGTDVAVSVGTC